MRKRLPKPMAFDTLKHRQAFSLIELLVVVSIIALLIGILLPTIGLTRSAAKLTACTNNLRQIGVGMNNYAISANNKLPVGPDAPMTLYGANWHGANWNQVASNLIYTGVYPPESQFVGVGVIMKDYLPEPKAAFCPGDDSTDPIVELALLRTVLAGGSSVDPATRPDGAIYTSYYIRQLDQAPVGRTFNMGLNYAGRQASCLAMDANSLSPGQTRTNHNNEKVNLLYLDGHVKNLPNTNDMFSLRAADSAGYPNMAASMRRLDHIFVRADFAETGNPLDAPDPPAVP